MKKTILTSTLLIGLGLSTFISPAFAFMTPNQMSANAFIDAATKLRKDPSFGMQVISKMEMQMGGTSLRVELLEAETEACSVVIFDMVGDGLGRISAKIREGSLACK